MDIFFCGWQEKIDNMIKGYIQYNEGLKGIDKESVSLLACRIRSIKVPDAYKNKGIRYENEIVRIKPTDRFPRK